MNPSNYNPNITSLKGTLVSRYFNYLKSHRIFFFTSLSILLVITAYIWFISFGSWVRWPAITNYDGYYNELASAFQHGSLSLEIKPSPALLALHDPYDPTARNSNNVPYPIDFSLYHGNYYLYFGPVPALFLLVIRFLGIRAIGDHYLVFGFILGMFIFQSWMIIKIWGRFFKSIPIWMMSLCILFCGLVSPMPWILTEARVYEAASASGQFFFLVGLYFIVIALDRESVSVGQLAIAGISWALAIGSRVTQIVPISFVVLMIEFWAFRTYSQTKLRSKVILPLIAVGLPLLLGMAILGWYNWARFDSAFETGFYYELAGSFLQKYSHVLFSPLYLLPNLYNYLVMPPKIKMTFPFLQPVAGYGAAKFYFIHLPQIYHEGGMTGILFSAPFVLFAGIPVLSLLFRKRDSNGQVDQGNDAFLFKWLIISLLGAFLFGFAPIVIYFFVETRFLTDFMPSLVLLSIIGFWQGYNFMRHKPALHKLYVAVGIILIITSIVISVLLAFSAHAEQFQEFNPILWNQLIRLFSQ
jgi:hypothetical protein